MSVCADYPKGKCNTHRHTNRKRMLLLDAGEGFAYVCYSKALANGLISREYEEWKGRA